MTKPNVPEKEIKQMAEEQGVVRGKGYKESVWSYIAQDKIRNFFNIYSTDSLMCTSEVPGMELRTVEDTKTNKIQPVEGDFAVQRQGDRQREEKEQLHV